VLTDAHTAVQAAKADNQIALDPDLLTQLRERYDKAVTSGITHNRHRDWHTGNHPGFALAAWLATHAEQALRSALSEARRQGLVSSNAAWRLPLPRCGRPQAVAWTLEREALWRATGATSPLPGGPRHPRVGGRFRRSPGRVVALRRLRRRWSASSPARATCRFSTTCNRSSRSCWRTSPCDRLPPQVAILLIRLSGLNFSS